MTDTSKALELADDLPILFKNGFFDGGDIEEICAELRRQRAEIAELKAELERIRSLEPVHFRALLDKDQVPHQLKTSMHVCGFRTWKAADEFVASERDMNGWNYTIEPLFTLPPNLKG